MEDQLRLEVSFITTRLGAIIRGQDLKRQLAKSRVEQEAKEQAGPLRKFLKVLGA